MPNNTARKPEFLCESLLKRASGGAEPVFGKKETIAVDTNILIYAHRKDSPWHDRAAAVLTSIAESPEPWAIPWPCVHEFFSVATHPRIYKPRSPADRALADLETWFESPSLRLIAEPSGYWPILRKLLRTSASAGPTAHNARIAAICQAHGVTTLLSADRDFSRFGISVRNPLTRH